MHLKPARCQPRTQLSLEGFGLSFALAVNKTVVGISTSWKFGMHVSHPQIKRIVHEEIGEARTNNTALRGAARSRNNLTILLHRRSGSPSKCQLQAELWPVGPTYPQQTLSIRVFEDHR
jgi:hypothetical protein